MIYCYIFFYNIGGHEELNTAVAERKKVSAASTKEELFLSIIVSIMIPLVIFIAVPFDIFCSNLEEFNCRLGDFLPLNIAMTVIMSSVIFIIISLLRGTVRKAVTSGLIGISVMLFIQSNFMNKGIEYLVGDNMEKSGVSLFGVIMNAVLWVGVIALFVFLGVFFSKKSDLVKYISMVLALATIAPSVASCISLSITTKDLFGVTYTEAPYFSTTKNLTTISKDRNVFVFCIDRFDDSFFRYALENEPDIFNELEGFTYFDNNISLYGHTYPSVSYMLTGRLYDVSARKEFLKNVYKDAETFRTLKDNGYKINVYTKAFYAFDSGTGLGPWCDNFIEADMHDYVITNYSKLSMLMVKMSLFRCLPYALKSSVGSSLGSDDANRFVSYNLEYPVYSLDLKKVYGNVSTGGFTLTDDKVFSFIHVEGCHSARYDENWEKNLTIDTTSPEEICVSLRHSFEIINVYIEEMKKSGVYDNATIIITGDHGTPVTDYTELRSTRLTTLLVKSSNDSEGDLSISHSPVSHENLWGTIFASENIKLPENFEPSVFYVYEHDTAPRHYYWHKFGKSQTSFSEMVYEVGVNARDFSNWTLVKEDDYEGTIYK